MKNNQEELNSAIKNGLNSEKLEIPMPTDAELDAICAEGTKEVLGLIGYNTPLTSEAEIKLLRIIEMSVTCGMSKGVEFFTKRIKKLIESK